MSARTSRRVKRPGRRSLPPLRPVPRSHEALSLLVLLAGVGGLVGSLLSFEAGGARPLDRAAGVAHAERSAEAFARTPSLAAPARTEPVPHDPRHGLQEPVPIPYPQPHLPDGCDLPPAGVGSILWRGSAPAPPALEPARAPVPAQPSFAEEPGLGERVSADALRWLKRHQAPDGRWPPQGWACDGPGCAAAAGAGRETATSFEDDVAATSQALLAFLAHGHTHRFGTFKRTVNRGLQWLKRQTARLSGGAGARSDAHCLATYALCEAYAVSRDFTLRRHARALAEPLLADDPRASPWRLPALLAIRDSTTSPVPEAAFRSVDARLREHPDSFTTLAHGLALAVARRRGASRGSVEAGVRNLVKELPEWEPGRADLAAWLATSEAAFQLGGAAWRRWQPALRSLLAARQEAAGCRSGLWLEPPSQAARGHVRTTAAGALVFATHYRYERFED